MKLGIHFPRLITVETGNQHSRDERRIAEGNPFSKMDKLKDVRRSEEKCLFHVINQKYIYIFHLNTQITYM